MSTAATRARWKLLRRFVRRSQNIALDDAQRGASVRRFTTYGLVDSKMLDQAGKHMTVEYTLGGGLRVRLRQRKEDSVSLEDFEAFNESGVDNTGNVCLWLAEEVLSHWILQRIPTFEGAKVCELGAGVGLAAFVLSMAGNPSTLLVTDGNQEVVENLQHNIELLQTDTPGCLRGSVTASTLLWDEGLKVQDVPDAGTFDFIFAADCLFFRQYQRALVHTIAVLLRPGGKAFLLAPTRGGTMREFLDLAKDRFEITEEEEYNADVWAAHQKALGTEQYEPDIHFPLLLTLELKPQD